MELDSFVAFIVSFSTLTLANKFIFSGLGLLTLVTSLYLCATEGGMIVWIDIVIG